MSVRRRTAFTPSLGRFISLVITPAVLVFGVILLVLFNFTVVLKAMQVTDDHFHSTVAFSQQALAFRFQENAGFNRPVLRYLTRDLLSYSEWGSTVSIDGAVSELWNNYHGYDVDETKRQLYSTISGDSWQLTQIVTLVDSQTMTVTYNFTSRRADSAHYVFDIAHVTPISGSAPLVWSHYKTGKGTFTAQVLNGDGTTTGTATGSTNNQALGVLSLTATGVASPTPAIVMQRYRMLPSKQGGTVGLAQSFFTEYKIDNPSPQRMVTLGTETITFQPGPADPDAAPPGDIVVPVQ